jgi:sugar fermentation stimulation protein A
MKILLKIENYEKGVIIERLNRFVVKARVKNKNVLAHLNNTGRLEDFIKKWKVGLFLPINAGYGNPVADTLRRYGAGLMHTERTKLKFRLSMVKESKNIYSIIDTSLQMKCFEIALEKGYISWLKGAKILKRNFRINHSLIDYLIQHKNKKYFLEVKSAVMKYKNFAMYPDCPSIRGQKHIKELINIQSTRITDRINYPNNSIYPNEGPNNIPEYRPNKNKIFGEHSGNKFGQDSGRNINPRLSALYPYKSVVLFIAGMKNISAFSPNKNADPKIYELLKIAKNKGVKIKAIQIYFDEKRKSIILENDNLPVVL